VKTKTNHIIVNIIRPQRVTKSLTITKGNTNP